MEYLPIVILTAFAAFFGIISLVDLLSHHAKNLRRCWFILLSFFDKEFIARTFNIHQVDFLCKSRKPADPQYVDEWFRFKKMF